MKNDHYGYRHGQIDALGRRHPGNDYNGPGSGGSDEGTPLESIASGLVTLRAEGSNCGWGNVVIYEIDMEAFFKGYELFLPDWCPKRVWVKYAHCKQIFVKEGERIQAGQKIALLGGTPYVSVNGKLQLKWSPHLHWDIKKLANGPFYYPPKGLSKDAFEEIYLDPERFIAMVNEHIVTASEQKPGEPSSDLIQGSGPEIYYFNGKKRFHIPDWFTFDTLFGTGGMKRIEKVNDKILEQIEEDGPFVSIKP